MRFSAEAETSNTAMPSFPLIHELPQVLETAGWHWEPAATENSAGRGFWVGTDTQGRRWLTKLRGGFKAYREIVFDRLAQAMGWSCQSTTFMRLDPVAAELFRLEPGEIHGAHWFMEEHRPEACAPHCPIPSLVNKAFGTIEELERLEISHLQDWPKGRFSACLFGGTEPPGPHFTMAHEHVIIDSELMFVHGQPPTDFESVCFLHSERGHQLAIEVCEEYLGLSERTIQESLIVPAGISFEMLWEIGPRLHESRAFAKDYGDQLKARISS